jgi:hypothetical protein
MILNGRLALKGRKQIAAVRGKALFIVSIVMLPVLAGCSASTDFASIPHSTIADMFGSSRGAAEAAVMPPPQNAAAGVASQPGATVPPAPAIRSADASAPPLPLAPTTYGANTSVPQAVSATSVSPGVSPDQPAPPPANPFYTLYDSLKGDTEVCSLPTEPCDNNHRVTN